VKSLILKKNQAIFDLNGVEATLLLGFLWAFSYRQGQSYALLVFYKGASFRNCL